jgi:hypothetical protein
MEMNTKQITRRHTAALLAAGLGAGLLLVQPQNAEAQTSARSTAAKTVRIYGNSSRTVTMELKNAPVREAIQQLFLKAKVDYILDPNIVGTTTLKVTNVPFETALRLLIDGSDVPIYVTRDSGVYDIRVHPAAFRYRSNVRTASYIPPEPIVEPVVPVPAAAPAFGVAPGLQQGLPGGTGYGAPGAPAVGAPIGGTGVVFDPYASWGGWNYPVFYPVYGTPVVPSPIVPFGVSTGFGLNTGLGLNGFVFPNGNGFFFR